MNPAENNDSNTMNGFPKEFTDDYSKKIAAPNQVFTRSAYKNFISTFTVQNDEKVKGFKGLKILKEVKRKLESTMQEHGQIKYYAVARLLMKKKLDDKVLGRAARAGTSFKRVFAGGGPRGRPGAAGRRTAVRVRVTLQRARRAAESSSSSRREQRARAACSEALLRGGEASLE